MAQNKVPEIRTGDNRRRASRQGRRQARQDRARPSQIQTERRRAGSGGAPRSRPLSVVISGVNIAKRHTKPRQKMQNDRAPQMQQGGIVEKPMPLDVSNVMIVCPRCDRVTRVKHERLGSGQSVRVCGHCREQLEAGA